LDEIVRKAKAPSCSNDYHFPGCKEQIAAEAISFSGRTLTERIRANWAQKRNAAEAVRVFMNRLSSLLGTSRFDSSGLLSITASETATTNERLNQCCQQAFTRLIEVRKEKLGDCGFTVAEATRLSTVVTAMILGGVILSGTFHSRNLCKRSRAFFGEMLQAVDPATRRHS